MASAADEASLLRGFNRSGGAIAGVGVDILDAAAFRRLAAGLEDPFFRRTFTPSELARSRLAPDPVLDLTLRFAAKEAAFKCLGLDGNGVRLDRIEIDLDEEGRGRASLLGPLAEASDERGIEAVFLRVSLASGKALAIAIAKTHE